MSVKWGSEILLINRIAVRIVFPYLSCRPFITNTDSFEIFPTTKLKTKTSFHALQWNSYHFFTTFIPVGFPV